jgi:hypothetical protein
MYSGSIYSASGSPQAPDPAFNMQRLWIELLLRPYNLPAYNYPRLLPCFLLILLLLVFYIYLAGCLTEALIIQLLYKLSSTIAT